MVRLGSRLSIFLVAAAALGACSKQGDAPTDFGVNVTVDASKLTSAERMAITQDTLTVVENTAGATPVVRHPTDLASVLKAGGPARFHYTPDKTTIMAGATLLFGLDVSGAGGLIASASGSVTLKATAVTLMLTLESAQTDGGPSNDGSGGAGGGDGGGGFDANGKQNGVACVADGECGSGHCSPDGVCCDTKCDGVCESCNQTATKGMCTPFADGTDPDMECVAKFMQAEPDAGAAPEGGASEGGASTDGAPVDASGMEVAPSDAAVINTPDGGIMSKPSVCGGTCNGHSACRYPDATKSCGTSFCNTRKEVASFACDSHGGCQISLSQCTDYACNDTTGACRTSCSAHIECLLGEYCDNHQCVGKNANGIPCTTGDECASGFCSTGVCCNTSCDGAGLSCNPGGAQPAGKCQCPGVTCAAGVACQVFYRDADNDTFGDSSGTIPAGTAKAGCAGAPPAGFVADNTDCDDGDPNVNINQTGYFAVPSAGKHTFDYNCSGTVENETPVYVGGTCKFCGPVGACDSTSTTCSTANQVAAFQCPQESYILRPLSEPMSSSPDVTPVEPITPLGGPGAALAPRAASAAGPPAIIPQPIPRYQCCGCYTNDRTAFLGSNFLPTATPTGCGLTGNTYTCGSCSSAGLGPSALTPTSKQQRCR
jgi:hypothetical protein